jgi:hypothetical protein
MTTHRSLGLLTPTQLVDEYFIENRNRVLEIAAFLDRIDRADPRVAASDFRMQAFADVLTTLTNGRPNRLRQIQMRLSDPTTEPRPALDRKGAIGAFDPATGEPSEDDL